MITTGIKLLGTFLVAFALYTGDVSWTAWLGMVLMLSSFTKDGKEI